MDRREALKVTIGAAVCWGAQAKATATSPAIPIIDCHLHLFDTDRAGGVPWPPESDKVIYRPALPGRYEKIARPLGVVGAIAVEASPLPGDNDWVLRQTADHPIFVGFVGDLIPGSPSYARELERLRRNPVFVGIRYGNLWSRDLHVDMKRPGFVADLRRLAGDGLALDAANPDATLIGAIVSLSDQVPDLRIVIDHLPNATLPVTPEDRKRYWNNLEGLGKNPNVFVKLSEVPERVRGELTTSPAVYRKKLDPLWEIFGEDHVLYGSDWPNSDHVASYGETLAILQGYVSKKGPAAQEKFFWRNSIQAYHWHRRAPDQPQGA